MLSLRSGAVNLTTQKPLFIPPGKVTGRVCQNASALLVVIVIAAAEG